MRRGLTVGLCLLVSGLGGFMASAEAAADPVRTLSVAGTGAAMYPDFEPGTLRYAATTTEATGGELEVTATTDDPAGVVLVQGTPTVSTTTTVSGLAEGEDVTVVIDDAAGRTTYSVMYLPAGFPALHATTNQASAVEPGLIGLTLNAFDGVQPAFGAIVDRNGVPVYAVDGPWDTDLKQQPNGEITVSRLTSKPGKTGYSLVTLDTTERDLPEIAWRDVAGDLTDTDGHDSIRLADGSTVLIGYEPRGDCGTGYLDATIQKQDPAGNVVFEWSSEGLEDEALNTIMWPTGGPCQRIDYAHVNSVVSVEDGDIIASFRHLSAAYRIATVAHDGHAKGEIIWKLGGEDSSFSFPGDPFPSGPCAQHTVGQLADGHILVFDNGTSGFCVDPSTPTDPAVARGETRVTEYALDLTATPKFTATLVWSYAPEGKYAPFAGSARRTPNGNTLIGWAADRSALATEVDAEGDTVWELQAADPPSGSQRYATYRAELLTALRPAVTMSGPADGATVLPGAVVAASGTCADWAGNALAACTVSGVVAGRLDTTSAGAHAWSVTASDGAGNLTTRTRHYTVLSPARKPDGLVRKAGATWWKGGGIYGSATDQTIQQRVRRQHTARSVWRVENDGTVAGAFRLTGSGSTARFRVQYFAGDTNVTAAVVGGTYRTASLAPGASMSLRVAVTPRRTASVGRQRTVLMSAVTVTGAPVVDRVATQVRVRR
jgi:hypothetical protein